jgi:small conductance mechanosensitive channel
MPDFDTLKNNFNDFLPKLLISIFIFILFLSLSIYTKNLILNIGSHTVLDTKSEALLFKRKLIYDQFANITYYIIFILGIIVAIINLGIPQTTVFAVLGTFGLALGLALQGLITNFIAGIYITLNDLFKINDFIKVSNFSGHVIEFTLLNTIIKDPSTNNIIHVPNNILRDNIVINFSKS